MVCGWFGCWSIRTEEIVSPSKVTSTCTAPFSVFTTEPSTTSAELPDVEEEDGDGATVSVVDGADAAGVSVDGA